MTGSRNTSFPSFKPTTTKVELRGILDLELKQQGGSKGTGKQTGSSREERETNERETFQREDRRSSYYKPWLLPHIEHLVVPVEMGSFHRAVRKAFPGTHAGGVRCSGKIYWA